MPIHRTTTQMTMPSVRLQEGDSGADVKKLQQALGLTGRKADGVFGEGTKKALKGWQKEHGMKADGVFGKETREAMAGRRNSQFEVEQPSSGRRPTQTQTPAADAPARTRPSSSAALGDTNLSASQKADLKRISDSRLRGGRTGTCVTCARANLNRLGFKGIPSSTGADPNNPRGAMVGMLKSGHWESLPIRGAEERTIKSPGFGTTKAYVLSGEEYRAAMKRGDIPQGAVVFQTKHGWQYSGGSKGNDMGIVRGKSVFNFAQMSRPDVYGAATKEVVIMVPK